MEKLERTANTEVMLAEESATDAGAAANTAVDIGPMSSSPNANATYNVEEERYDSLSHVDLDRCA